MQKRYYKNNQDGELIVTAGWRQAQKTKARAVTVRWFRVRWFTVQQGNYANIRYGVEVIGANLRTRERLPRINNSIAVTVKEGTMLLQYGITFGILAARALRMLRVYGLQSAWHICTSTTSLQPRSR